MASRKESGTPVREAAPFQTQKSGQGSLSGPSRAPRPQGPRAAHSPCALVVRAPQSRAWSRVSGHGSGGRGCSGEAGGRVRDAPSRRSQAVAPSLWGPGTEPVAASRCHPPRHRRSPRRRLAPARPQFPRPSLGCPPRGAPSRWETPGTSERVGPSVGAVAAGAASHAGRGVPSVLQRPGAGSSPVLRRLPVGSLRLPRRTPNRPAEGPRGGSD